VRAIRLEVRSRDEDAVTSALWEAGTAGLEVKPRGEEGLAIIAYFPDEASLAGLEEALAELPGPPRPEPVAIPEVDWVARFREGFHGLRVGSFDIVPVWALPQSRDPAERGLLVVDPGRAFGTGTHETTRLCLAAIEALEAEAPLGRTLDLGTGAGLLAVAAAKRGAGTVLGLDNDPEALEVARAHAALNRVPLALVRGDGGKPFRRHSFELVLANLMASLLLERRDEIASLLAPRGALVLSGVLEHEVGAIASAYKDLGAPLVRREGEWASLRFRKSR
jgi:ribosomal protein L11 methyltransferase